MLYFSIQYKTVQYSNPISLWFLCITSLMSSCCHIWCRIVLFCLNHETWRFGFCCRLFQFEANEVRALFFAFIFYFRLKINTKSLWNCKNTLDKPILMEKVAFSFQSCLSPIIHLNVFHCYSWFNGGTYLISVKKRLCVILKSSFQSFLHLTLSLTSENRRTSTF